MTDTRLDEVEMIEFVENPTEFVKTKYGEDFTVKHIPEKNIMVVTNQKVTFYFEFIEVEEDIGYIFNSDHFILNKFYTPICTTGPSEI